MLKISEKFCFEPQKRHSILSSHKALALYTQNFALEALTLSGELPIFLDTNVILGYYGMANKEKEKLLDFFKAQKNRIYLTRRVEEEFLKNRILAIRKDFFKPLNEITEDYRKMKSTILGSLQHFKENRKKILENDFPDIWEKLSNLEKNIISALENEVIEEDIKLLVAETTKENNNIEIIDEMLVLCSQFKVLNTLDITEVDFLISYYNKLLQEYKSSKDEKRFSYAFPGCGEKKGEGKEGDFIIFHEIIKYMKENNTSCIFLTNDTKKADWLQEANRPFIHYIEGTYSLTEQILLISHAESALKNISFENIHRQPEENSILVDLGLKANEEEYVIENENYAPECLMRMVLANQTLIPNLTFNIYYHPDYRGYREHNYIGLYGNKSIRAIGKIANIVRAHLDENNNLIIESSKNFVKRDEEVRIKAIINEAYDREWDISEGHLFFCVDKFYETNFVKVSIGASMGTKFFDLRKTLNIQDCKIETEEIAKLLRGKEWT